MGAPGAVGIGSDINDAQLRADIVKAVPPYQQKYVELIPSQVECLKPIGPIHTSGNKRSLLRLKNSQLKVDRLPDHLTVEIQALFG